MSNRCPYCNLVILAPRELEIVSILEKEMSSHMILEKMIEKKYVLPNRDLVDIKVQLRRLMKWGVIVKRKMTEKEKVRRGDKFMYKVSSKYIFLVGMLDEKQKEYLGKKTKYFSS